MNETPYQAADFNLVGSDDKQHALADYRGKWLVLYFYPKDDTPGCTTEACSIRDVYRDLADLGVEILGVSRDTPESHRKFIAKYHLNFELLSDEDAEVIKTYGAWGAKMFGKEGILRKTFVIDPDGQVQKVYPRVTPLGHGAQLIADLKALMD